MRFGLLNLLIGVVFLSGLLGCWLINPWTKTKRISNDESSVFCAASSPDGKLIVTLDKQGAIRLFNYPELNPLNKFQVKSSAISTFSDVGFVGNPPFALRFSEAICTEGGMPLGNGPNFDLNTGIEITLEEIQKKAVPWNPRGPNYNFYNSYIIDEYHAVVNPTDYTGWGWIHTRRYPHIWYGHFCRPEVWVTILAGLALVIQFFRYRKLVKARA